MDDIINKIDKIGNDGYPEDAREFGKFGQAVKNIERRKSLTDDDINSALQDIFKNIAPDDLPADLSARWHDINARLMIGTG